MLRFFGLVLCIAFALAASQYEFDDDEDNFEFPSDITTCQIDSPDRDECIKNSVHEQLPRLANGLEDLRIPPIDPLTVESKTATITLGDNFRATGGLRNLKIHGISKSQILDIKTEITKTHINTEFKVFAKQIIAEGYYRGDGHFMNLKIKSKGFFNATMDDVSIQFRTEGEIIGVNGTEYLKVTHFDFTPHFGKFKVFATGIFPDPEMSRMVLDFANQYWPFLMNELMPQIKLIIEPAVLDIFNTFTLHVPIRKMLYYGDNSA